MGAAIALVREHHETYRQAAQGVGFDPARAHRELLTLARRRAADDVAMLEPLLVAHEGRVHEVLGLGSFQEYCSRLFGW